MNAPSPSLPARRQWLIDGFDWFVRGYVRKHFHTLAVNRDRLRESLQPQDNTLVVYGNHCSWWDPLIAMLLRKLLFPGFKLYAPIDSDSLEKYAVFGQMGFFGVKHGTAKGAADFLRQSEAILNTPGSSLWITPEGRFCDVRDRSQRLMPGLGHLAHRLQSMRPSTGRSHTICFIPAAAELSFWEERLPECLVRLGAPIKLRGSRQEPIDQPPDIDMDKPRWCDLLESALRETQDQLAADCIARDSGRFEILLRGRGGSWSAYDGFRRMRGWLRGRRVNLNHGDKLS